MMEQKKRGYHNCSVDGCLNTTFNSELSFFSVPVVSERRTEWLRLIHREDLIDSGCLSTRVCEAHFSPNSIRITPTRKLLKKNSIPQRLLPFQNGFANKGIQTIFETADANVQCEYDLKGSVEDFNPDRTPTRVCDPEAEEEPNDDCCSFWCNQCQKGIVKWRFVCVQCTDYDLCAECAVRGDHPQHYMLRVPENIDPEKAHKVLKLIRSNLTVNLGDDETTSNLGDDETTSNLGDDATISPQGADLPFEIKIEVEEEPSESKYKDPLHDTVPDVESAQPSIRLATLSKTLDMIESEPKSPPAKRTAEPATLVTAKKRKDENEKTPNVVVITPVNKTAKKNSKSLELNKLPAPHIEENTSDLVIKTETLEIFEIDISPEDSTMDSFLISQEDELKAAVDSLKALEDTTENEKDTFVRERLKDSLQFGELKPETS